MSEDYSSGLNFSWPVQGDTNWAATIQEALAAISSHTHEAGGTGTQIPTAALASNAITEAKIRLSNTGTLRARNSVGSSDIDLLNADSGNRLEFPTVARFSSTETITATGTTAVSVSTTLTILNKASGGCTLAAGAEGQIKFIVNINSASVVVTPSSSNSVNTATIAQYGTVQYVYIGGEWRVFCAPSAGVTLA